MVQLAIYSLKLVFVVGLGQAAGDRDRWGGRKWPSPSLEYNRHQLLITTTSPLLLPAVLWPFQSVLV